MRNIAEFPVMFRNFFALPPCRIRRRRIGRAVKTTRCGGKRRKNEPGTAKTAQVRFANRGRAGAAAVLRPDREIPHPAAEFRANCGRIDTVRKRVRFANRGGFARKFHHLYKNCPVCYAIITASRKAAASIYFAEQF